MIQDDFRQSHYVVYELELPYCTFCTSNLVDGSVWNTPLTCEESSNAVYKLFFTSNNAPLVQQPSQSITGKSILNSKVFRCILSGSETTAKLKTGEGLASRSTMNIKCEDFDGDPGPINFSSDGTFFGKLIARNILSGKKITSRYYSIIDSQSAPVETYTSTHFIETVQLTDNVFSISAKDALKDIEKLTRQFPDPSEIETTADIDDSTTTIPVTSTVGLVPNGVIRIDAELMVIDTIDSEISLTVLTRGATIQGVDELISKTRVEEHDSGATVQPSYVMNKTFLPDVLQDLFDFAGLSGFVNYAQWVDELNQWTPDANLYGVFHTPADIDTLINSMCSDYMIDMWLDQPSQKIIIGAVSAWKLSQRQLFEGNDLNGLKSVTDSSSRFSRAYINSGKDYKTDNDDLVNFSRLEVATDIESEDTDFYGEIRLKELDPSSTMTTASAQILVNRFISRFSAAPKTLTFEMEERKLSDLNLGDIVDIYSRDKQSPSGQIVSARDRAQIIKIQPNLNGIGRTYKISATSYIPSLDGDDITLFYSDDTSDVIDLFVDLGGRASPVNLTVVLDGAKIGSSSINTPSITAGAMHIDSVIKIIMINGAQLAGKGGNGGNAGNSGSGATFALSGEHGANSYESSDIETHFYINYGVVDTFNTDGTLYAAGGGGGGASQITFLNDIGFTASGGGGGGSGIPSGLGGLSLPVIVPAEVLNVFSEQGSSGGFNSGGVGAEFVSGDPSNFIDAGDGGWSLDGTESLAGSTNGSFSVGDFGLAGGAFIGANITVYNLAADAAKLREGNSDPFTLVTV